VSLRLGHKTRLQLFNFYVEKNDTNLHTPTIWPPIRKVTDRFTWSLATARARPLIVSRLPLVGIARQGSWAAAAILDGS